MQTKGTPAEAIAHCTTQQELWRTVHPYYRALHAVELLLVKRTPLPKEALADLDTIRTAIRDLERAAQARILGVA